MRVRLNIMRIRYIPRDASGKNVTVWKIEYITPNLRAKNVLPARKAPDVPVPTDTVTCA